MDKLYIPQKHLENLRNLIKPNKVVVIYGPRRCGKTTLLKKFLEQVNEKYLLVQGEDIFVQEYLSSQSIAKLKNFIGDHKLLAVDEAQKIPNIGLNLKLIVDNIGGVKIIATGSASFDLYQKIGEPLTGRKITLRLFPLSQMELSQIEKLHETKANLETRLIFGSYPEAILAEDDQKRILYLKELVSSYLYKDILEVNGLKHSDRLVKILQLLAFQIGSEVSFTEIAGQVGLNKKTVERYLDLLEKVFVIFKIKGFSRNLRKEISKTAKYYFYDLGVRNALINNFNSINLRNDIGALWEDYIISERIKKQEYLKIQANNYFWRTYDKKEIDFIEEKEGKLYAFKIKWKKGQITPPADWLSAYPSSEFLVVSPDNYLEFIG
ncbi:MAG: AAA family ATPase [Candidatus Nealsonbacteria bacterium CG10_big_fil_rev_8_21_14_0_10_36_24]|uniref:AAA family ATPase n=2 Tax=Candidatus Nealsoniibacteriota TaxID=1817911 RepID=A0A2H0YPE9_9BACT|nr:MAG: AAA family ATPase [Candidatus Nealsonbacteria bacterium CG10_big_fil_rev_8_21_14_0_10_36_24]PIS40374.1 MAG: AAA family ATPase [Candidatus Nealsonbacteria bacterium CG08_land_8_20_14_0_20_36_22]